MGVGISFHQLQEHVFESRLVAAERLHAHPATGGHQLEELGVGCLLIGHPDLEPGAAIAGQDVHAADPRLGHQACPRSVHITDQGDRVADAACAPQELLDGRLRHELAVVQDGDRVAHPLHVAQDVGAVEDGGCAA
jgi:hypothetical protein